MSLPEEPLDSPPQPASSPAVTPPVGEAPGAAEPVMVGFPPSPAHRWRRGSWQTAPENRWSFRHLREVVPTAKVRRGSGAGVPLPAGPALDLRLPVPTAEGERPLRDVLHDTVTDGFLVLHEGRLVAEWYAEGYGRHDTHVLMSVSKSVVGSLVGILVERGAVDVEAPVDRYVPELADAGYGGARVRDVLDMRSGIAFSEAYTDPDAEVRRIEEVIGWAPRTDEALPTSMYDYLATLRAKRGHGDAFEYRSCETDLLGWVCERATGTRLPTLLSDLLWSRLGTEDDMDAAVDPAGAVFADGGLACSLRDLARFGRMILDYGQAGGEQVVPGSWIEDTLAGAEDSRTVFADSGHGEWLPGGAYRNQFWVPEASSRTLMCMGIHGQLVWIDRVHRLVVVKQSSWPRAQDLTRLTATFAAVRAVTEHLTTATERVTSG
ncbi:serine hydrolase [Kineococcus gynurae]|uniref:Serine hydrolase n=1 Tax=Kineococcus gynurae TaxID=452979 RepID=A0ABV5LR91_9ACTN